MSTLAVVFDGGFQRRSDGAIGLPDKLVTGMLAYQARWPGSVALVARANDTDGPYNLGTQWREPGSLPFDILLDDDFNTTVDKLRPALAMLPTKAAIRYRATAPYVVVTEKSALQELRAQLSLGLAAAAIPRAFAGSLRRHQQYTAAVKAARGLQCNGYPAWDAFARHSTKPLLFFDTRLGAADVTAAKQLRTGVQRPLRLAFSGRLSGDKGPSYAVDAQRRLAAEGLPVRLTMFGSGPLLDDLTQAAGPGVTFAGDVSFSPEWVSRIPQEVDLMVLPHPQGDPAGTYLEAAGLGVPFVAFDNLAARALSTREGLGWCVPIGDTRQLARLIRELNSSSSRVAEASERGVAFMTEHSYEREFDRRVEHLQSCL